MFINFVDLHCEIEHLHRIQLVMTEVQHILYHYNGAVRQFMLDDKGVVMICFFGLGNRKRIAIDAMCCSKDVAKNLSLLRLRAGIGLATGECYCGLVGHDHRCEYTISGPAVNTSARLMGCATVIIAEAQKRVGKSEKTSGDASVLNENKTNSFLGLSRNIVLCDHATKQTLASAGSSMCSFESESVTLKGKSKAVKVYIPIFEDNTRKKAKKAMVKLVAVMSQKQLGRVATITQQRRTSVAGELQVSMTSSDSYQMSGSKLSRVTSSFNAQSAKGSCYQLNPALPNLNDHMLFGSMTTDEGSGELEVYKVLAVLNVHQETVEYDVIYACVPDKSIKYRLVSILGSATKNNLIEVLDTKSSAKEEVVYRLKDRRRIRGIYSQLLDFYCEETHLRVAQLYEKRFKMGGHRLRERAALLDLIANHFGSSGEEHAKKAAYYMEMAGHQFRAEGNLDKAEQKLNESLKLMNDQFAREQREHLLSVGLLKESLGAIAAEKGDDDDAYNLFLEALDAFQVPLPSEAKADIVVILTSGDVVAKRVFRYNPHEFEQQTATCANADLRRKISSVSPYKRVIRTPNASSVGSNRGRDFRSYKFDNDTQAYAVKNCLAFTTLYQAEQELEASRAMGLIPPPTEEEMKANTDPATGKVLPLYKKEEALESSGFVTIKEDETKFLEKARGLLESDSDVSSTKRQLESVELNTQKPSGETSSGTCNIL